MFSISSFPNEQGLPLCSCGKEAEHCMGFEKVYLWRCSACLIDEREEIQRIRWSNKVSEQVKEKVMPTVEQSLKSISWHLKVLVDEIKGMRNSLESKGKFDDIAF